MRGEYPRVKCGRLGDYKRRMPRLHSAWRLLPIPACRLAAEGLLSAFKTNWRYSWFLEHGLVEEVGSACLAILHSCDGGWGWGGGFSVPS